MTFNITKDEAVSILTEHMSNHYVGNVEGMSEETLAELPDELTFVVSKETQMSLKTYKTFENKPARLIADDLKGEHPLVWAIGYKDEETTCQTTTDFKLWKGDPFPYIAEEKGESE